MTLHKIFAISGLALTSFAAPNMSLASIGGGFDLNPLILDTAPTATIDDGSYEDEYYEEGYNEDYEQTPEEEPEETATPAG